MNPAGPEEATIECKCGRCSITVADGKATCHFQCGCEDCRQAIQYGHVKGGDQPVPLPELYYMRSDLVDVKGKEYMHAFKLREDGDSTRVYCTECYSILGVDHPAYEDNVFLNFPEYCNNQGDLSIPLVAYVMMVDYTEDIGPLPEEDVPLFTTLRFEQEQQRLWSIAVVGDSFREPEGPIEGITFSALIKELPPVTVLGLEKGKSLL